MRSFDRACQDGRAIAAEAFAETRQIDLRPCPFCGSDRVAVYIVADPHVVCGNCGAEGPAVERGQWDGRAAHLWNARMGESK